MQGSVLDSFPEISHLIFTRTLQGKHYLRITDEERGSERGSKLTDATQIVNGRARFLTQVYLIPKPMSFPLYCLSHLKYVWIVQIWFLNLCCSDEMTKWSEIKIECCLYREIWVSRKSLKSFFCLTDVLQFSQYFSNWTWKSHKS